MITDSYGKAPTPIGLFDFQLPEVMYYLYLPVRMDYGELRLPGNVRCCEDLIFASLDHARIARRREFRYAYLSARKGYATPDNPLNRPGWHADGFGSEDLNFVWWRGPGTRFAEQDFHFISSDHHASLGQFERQVRTDRIVNYPEGGLYALDRYVVHATPIIKPPGCMRQYVKVSLSEHRYALADNSHNYLFDYDWPVTPREEVRNDPTKAGRDYA